MASFGFTLPAATTALTGPSEARAGATQVANRTSGLYGRRPKDGTSVSDELVGHVAAHFGRFPAIACA